MDYIKLVESGVYSKDMLNERDKAFIEGMEYVRDNMLTKDFIGEDEFDNCFSPTFAKIQKEIFDNVTDCFRDALKNDICEAIVDLIDDDGDDD